MQEENQNQNVMKERKPKLHRLHYAHTTKEEVIDTVNEIIDYLNEQ